MRLYEDFARSRAKQKVDDSVGEREEDVMEEEKSRQTGSKVDTSQTHIFQVTCNTCMYCIASDIGGNYIWQIAQK